MTGEDIRLVRLAYSMVQDRQTAFALRFYDRLFDIDPALRPLFGGDFGALARSLMATLGLVVGALDDLTPLLPRIDELARRHVVYGVRRCHYPIVGRALLDTFHAELGPRFTAEMAAAWAAAYAILSGRMIDAARPHEDARAA